MVLFSMKTKPYFAAASKSSVEAWGLSGLISITGIRNSSEDVDLMASVENGYMCIERPNDWKGGVQKRGEVKKELIELCTLLRQPVMTLNQYCGNSIQQVLSYCSEFRMSK